MDKPFSAYQGDEPYIFVCYAHGDSDVVYPEIAWLHEKGINLWYDEGIPAGDNWRGAIGDALIQARKMLFYISKRSLESDHCNREINLALDEGLDVIPIYLESVDLTSDLKVGLNRLQALHREQDTDYRHSLITALGGIDTSPEPARTSSTTFNRRPVLIMGLSVLVAGLLAWGWIQFQEIAEPADRSIVVLPFDNLSTDPNDGYLADGLSDELMIGLSRVPSLRVAARTSSFYFKTHPTDLATIGDTLNVSYVVEGSVRRDEDDLRIVARLVRISDGHDLASLVLDRKFTHLLQLQSEIALTIVDALEIHLADADIEMATTPGTDNLDAYNLFLRGGEHLRRGTLDDSRSAQGFFRSAIELDPYFFQAYSELHRSIQLEAAATGDWEAGYERQMAVLDLANERDPTGSRPTLLRDQIKVHLLNRNYSDAEQTLRKILISGKSDAGLLDSYAMMLGWVGLFKPAVGYAELAVETDPFNIIAIFLYGGNLAASGQHDQAIEQFDRCLQIVPFSTCFMTKARSLARTGKLQSALAVISGTPFGIPSWECVLYGEAGQPCPDPNYDPSNPIQSISLAAYAGDLDRAFALLETQVSRPYGSVELTGFLAQEAPAEVRQDPRYTAVLEKLNLGESWRAELCKRAQTLTPVTGVVVECGD